MEGQEYLNQLAASTRPAKTSATSKIFSSKFFIVGMVGVIALIIILIIGMILGGAKGGEENLNYSLLLHIDNTSSLIQTFQPNLKSSDLRSSSASLYSVLTNTSRDLTNYLVDKYNYKSSNIDKGLVEEATLRKDSLESDFFEAKINGILDRTYAHKMTYEISVLMTEEAKIINQTKDDTLSGLLTTSYQSLGNLYEKFSNFSETK